MALNSHTVLNDCIISESTTSIATTPVAVTAVSPVSGYIVSGMAAAGGTTTGTTTVAVTVNGGSDIFGGALTVAAGTGARAGSEATLPLQGTSAVFINKLDQITFTPSGGTGSSIPGAFALKIREL